MLSCSKCLLPETAEATSFDEAGSCSVCAQIEVRDTQINWDERYKQLMELVGHNILRANCLSHPLRSAILIQC